MSSRLQSIITQNLEVTHGDLEDERARQFYSRSQRITHKDGKIDPIVAPSTLPSSRYSARGTGLSSSPSTLGFSGYKPKLSTPPSASPTKRPQTAAFGATSNRTMSRLNPHNPQGVYAHIAEHGVSSTHAPSASATGDFSRTNPFGRPSSGRVRRPSSHRSANYTSFVPVEERGVEDLLTVTPAPTTTRHATTNNLLTVPVHTQAAAHQQEHQQQHQQQQQQQQRQHAAVASWDEAWATRSPHYTAPSPSTSASRTATSTSSLNRAVHAPSRTGHAPRPSSASGRMPPRVSGPLPGSRTQRLREGSPLALALPHTQPPTQTEAHPRAQTQIGLNGDMLSSDGGAGSGGASEYGSRGVQLPQNTTCNPLASSSHSAPIAAAAVAAMDALPLAALADIADAVRTLQRYGLVPPETTHVLTQAPTSGHVHTPGHASEHGSALPLPYDSRPAPAATAAPSTFAYTSNSTSSSPKPPRSRPHSRPSDIDLARAHMPSTSPLPPLPLLALPAASASLSPPALPPQSSPSPPHPCSFSSSSSSYSSNSAYPSQPPPQSPPSQLSVPTSALYDSSTAPTTASVKSPANTVDIDLRSPHIVPSSTSPLPLSLPVQNLPFSSSSMKLSPSNRTQSHRHTHADRQTQARAQTQVQAQPQAITQLDIMSSHRGVAFAPHLPTHTSTNPAATATEISARATAWAPEHVGRVPLSVDIDLTRAHAPSSAPLLPMPLHTLPARSLSLSPAAPRTATHPQQHTYAQTRRQAPMHASAPAAVPLPTLSSTPSPDLPQLPAATTTSSLHGASPYSSSHQPSPSSVSSRHHFPTSAPYPGAHTHPYPPQYPYQNQARAHPAQNEPLAYPYQYGDTHPQNTYAAPAYNHSLHTHTDTDTNTSVTNIHTPGITSTSAPASSLPAPVDIITLYALAPSSSPLPPHTPLLRLPRARKDTRLASADNTRNARMAQDMHAHDESGSPTLETPIPQLALSRVAKATQAAALGPTAVSLPPTQSPIVPVAAAQTFSSAPMAAGMLVGISRRSLAVPPVDICLALASPASSLPLTHLSHALHDAPLPCLPTAPTTALLRPAYAHAATPTANPISTSTSASASASAETAIKPTATAPVAFSDAFAGHRGISLFGGGDQPADDDDDEEDEEEVEVEVEEEHKEANARENEAEARQGRESVHARANTPSPSTHASACPSGLLPDTHTQASKYMPERVAQHVSGRVPLSVDIDLTRAHAPSSAPLLPMPLHTLPVVHTSITPVATVVTNAAVAATAPVIPAATIAAAPPAGAGTGMVTGVDADSSFLSTSPDSSPLASSPASHPRSLRPSSRAPIPTPVPVPSLRTPLPSPPTPTARAYTRPRAFAPSTPSATSTPTSTSTSTSDTVTATTPISACTAASTSAFTAALAPPSSTSTPTYSTSSSSKYPQPELTHSQTHSQAQREVQLPHTPAYAHSHPHTATQAQTQTQLPMQMWESQAEAHAPQLDATLPSRANLHPTRTATTAATTPTAPTRTHARAQATTQTRALQSKSATTQPRTQRRTSTQSPLSQVTTQPQTHIQAPAWTQTQVHDQKQRQGLAQRQGHLPTSRVPSRTRRQPQPPLAPRQHNDQQQQQQALLQRENPPAAAVAGAAPPSEAVATEVAASVPTAMRPTRARTRTKPTPVPVPAPAQPMSPSVFHALQQSLSFMQCAKADERASRAAIHGETYREAFGDILETTMPENYEIGKNVKRRENGKFGKNDDMWNSEYGYLNYDGQPLRPQPKTGEMCDMSVSHVDNAADNAAVSNDQYANSGVANTQMYTQARSHAHEHTDGTAHDHTHAAAFINGGDASQVDPRVAASVAAYRKAAHVTYDHIQPQFIGGMGVFEDEDVRALVHTRQMLVLRDAAEGIARQHNAVIGDAVVMAASDLGIRGSGSSADAHSANSTGHVGALPQSSSPQSLSSLPPDATVEGAYAAEVAAVTRGMDGLLRSVRVDQSGVRARLQGDDARGEEQEEREEEPERGRWRKKQGQVQAIHSNGQGAGEVRANPRGREETRNRKDAETREAKEAKDNHVEKPSQLLYPIRKRHERTIHAHATRVSACHAPDPAQVQAYTRANDSDYDSELDSDEDATHTEGTDTTGNSHNPEKPQFIDPFLLPSNALETPLPLELFPLVLHRVNDVAEDIRVRYSLQQLTARDKDSVTADAAATYGNNTIHANTNTKTNTDTSVSGGFIPADSYLAQFDPEDLYTQHTSYLEHTPEYLYDWLPAPSKDDLYRIYKLRDTFFDRQQMLASLRDVLRAKERNIQARKQYNDMYKGALPYWWEMHGKQFGEEMARNRLFGDGPSRVNRLWVPQTHTLPDADTDAAQVTGMGLRTNTIMRTGKDSCVPASI